MNIPLTLIAPTVIPNLIALVPGIFSIYKAWENFGIRKEIGYSAKNNIPGFALIALQFASMASHIAVSLTSQGPIAYYTCLAITLVTTAISSTYLWVENNRLRDYNAYKNKIRDSINMDEQKQESLRKALRLTKEEWKLEVQKAIPKDSDDYNNQIKNHIYNESKLNKFLGYYDISKQEAIQAEVLTAIPKDSDEYKKIIRDSVTKYCRQEASSMTQLHSVFGLDDVTYKTEVKKIVDQNSAQYKELIMYYAFQEYSYYPDKNPNLFLGLFDIERKNGLKKEVQRLIPQNSEEYKEQITDNIYDQAKLTKFLGHYYISTEEAIQTAVRQAIPTNSEEYKKIIRDSIYRKTEDIQKLYNIYDLNEASWSKEYKECQTPYKAMKCYNHSIHQEKHSFNMNENFTTIYGEEAFRTNKANYESLQYDLKNHMQDDYKPKFTAFQEYAKEPEVIMDAILYGNDVLLTNLLNALSEKDKEKMLKDDILKTNHICIDTQGAPYINKKNEVQVKTTLEEEITEILTREDLRKLQEKYKLVLKLLSENNAPKALIFNLALYFRLNDRITQHYNALSPEDLKQNILVFRGDAIRQLVLSTTDTTIGETCIDILHNNQANLDANNCFNLINTISLIAENKPSKSDTENISPLTDKQNTLLNHSIQNADLLKIVQKANFIHFKYLPESWIKKFCSSTDKEKNTITKLDKNLIAQDVKKFLNDAISGNIATTAEQKEQLKELATKLGIEQTQSQGQVR